MGADNLYIMAFRCDANLSELIAKKLPFLLYLFHDGFDNPNEGPIQKRSGKIRYSII